MNCAAVCTVLTRLTVLAVAAKSLHTTERMECSSEAKYDNELINRNPALPSCWARESIYGHPAHLRRLLHSYVGGSRQRLESVVFVEHTAQFKNIYNPRKLFRICWGQ